MPSALKMVVDSTEANADATMQGIYAAVRMRLACRSTKPRCVAVAVGVQLQGQLSRVPAAAGLRRFGSGSRCVASTGMTRLQLQMI